MKQNSVAHVSSVALLALKGLLTTSPDPIESTVAEAQHLSSSSGDADAQTVTMPSRHGELFVPPAKLPPLPQEAQGKMIRLLARMLNEYLLKQSSSSSGRPEAGDE